MNFSIIQKSQLEGAMRIDPDYYQSEFIEMANMINQNRNAELRDLTVWIKKGIFDLSPDNYRDGGIPFIRTLGINDPLIDFSETVFLDRDTHQKNKTTTLFPGDLVFTKIGANIGKSAILPPTFNEYNFSQNVAGAKVRQDIIKSGYLLAYLLSKFGKGQIDRAQMISGQGKLELEDLRKLKIVITHDGIQQKINSLVILAQDLKNQSLRWYQEAEKFLLEELGLKNAFFEDELSCVVNYADVVNVNRIDAEYFQPKYQKLIEKIKGKEAETLGELVSMRKGFEPGSEAYQEEGKLFIRVSSVSKLGIEEKDQKYLSEELYQKLKKDYEPKLGDILVTKDATPGIAYVIKEPLEGIISGGILDLKVKDNIESEYLALCISSIVGQWQAQRDAGGSIIAHWKPEQVKNLIIPILPTEIQKEIAGLVRKSHEERKKSKELLEQAKREVEEMIEGGGEN